MLAAIIHFKIEEGCVFLESFLIGIRWRPAVFFTVQKRRSNCIELCRPDSSEEGSQDIQLSFFKKKTLFHRLKRDISHTKIRRKGRFFSEKPMKKPPWNIYNFPGHSFLTNGFRSGNRRNPTKTQWNPIRSDRVLSESSRIRRSESVS
jgi:hypothetical protein